jgi:hypothetical protein
MTRFVRGSEAGIVAQIAAIGRPGPGRVVSICRGCCSGFFQGRRWRLATPAQPAADRRSGAAQNQHRIRSPNANEFDIAAANTFTTRAPSAM